jgi:flagellar hook-associated protein 3 FlgL
MRTTFNALYRESSAGIEAAAERLAEFQRQVATGKRMEKPSDDPSGQSTAIAEHATLAGIEQYSKATTDVSARLSVVDTLFADIIDQITLASTTAQSARGTTQAPNAREAAAQQLAGVRETLFENFNMRFQGAYVFGGAESNTAPFQKDASGTVLPYAGSTTEVSVEIDQNRSVRVAFDGSTITQGGAATDVFAVMDDLVAAARSGDNDALGQGIADLQAFMTRVVTIQSRVGADMNTAEDQQLRLSTAKLAGLKRLDQVEAANMAEAITSMRQAQTAYEAALGAAGTVTRVSLMDYLR